jgi:hypothetical protein
MISESKTSVRISLSIQILKISMIATFSQIFMSQNKIQHLAYARPMRGNSISLRNNLLLEIRVVSSSTNKNFWKKKQSKKLTSLMKNKEK